MSDHSHPDRTMRLCHRLLLAVALLLGSLPAQWTVDVDLPESGHVWAVGPLPIDAPPVLVGPRGIRAQRIETLGTHSAIYALETFAELAPRAPITLVPPIEGDVVAPWWAHPAVLDDPAAVAGTVSVGGHRSAGPAWSLVSDAPARKRFRAVHDCGAYWVSLWCDVYARSPVVHVVGFVARKDRRAERHVDVRLAFGEVVAFPWQRLHGGRLKLDDGAIVGSIDLERAGVYPLRFSLLCSRQPAPLPGPAEDADVPLDDLDAAARQAGAAGPRWFSPTAWSGTWLGVRGVGETAAGTSLARAGYATFLGAHRMTDMRPWASMPAASQGGSQPSLGLSWFAPVFVAAHLHSADVHLWSAEDWALRPMHLLETGAPEPLRDLQGRFRATVASRQVFGIESIGDQHLPTYRTRGALDVHIGNGQVDQRMPPDELHTADGPLIAAYAMTGDPLCGWLLGSVRELDRASRAVSSGWRSNGRGHGRTVSSMLLAARTMRPAIHQQVVEHLLQRLALSESKADTRALPQTAISRPVELYDDRRLACDAPAMIPYEEAQGAWGWWLLWEDSRDDRALDAAYRYGLTVAATLYLDGGEWRVPYACHQLADGSPLSEEQIRDPRYVHPSTWTIYWAGCGLRAVINAAVRMQVPANHAPLIERARAAVEWIDSRDLRAVEQIHQALHGAAVAPRPVR